MNEYLISAVDPTAYLPGHYRAVVVLDATTVNITHTENPTLPGDELILGVNPQTGLPVELTNMELYKQFRPLGNAGGDATGYLGAHNWAGAPLRKLGDPEAVDPIMQLYPAADAPFAVDIRHKYYDTPATPSSTGWGFRSEIVGGAESRDITARSMGAYDDPEYSSVLWPAIGAYQLGESDWQTDESGNPLQVWFLDSWDGMRLAEKRSWYVVMLLGSAWEGKAALPVDVDSVQYLFWEHDQSGGGGGEILPWSQPAGAHDAYQIGAQVTHDGSTWESTAANNVWEPGVYGWVVIEAATDPEPEPEPEPDPDPVDDILPWVQPISTNPYQIGDKVTHNGSTWESTAANNVWAPGVYGWVTI